MKKFLALFLALSLAPAIAADIEKGQITKAKLLSVRLVSTCIVDRSTQPPKLKDCEAKEGTEIEEVTVQMADNSAVQFTQPSVLFDTEYRYVVKNVPVQIRRTDLLLIKFPKGYRAVWDKTYEP